MGRAGQWDVEGKRLKAMVHIAWGCYPLFEISERHDEQHLIDIYGNYSITIDTEQLDLVDDWSLNYVEHLIDEAIRAKLVNPDIKTSYHSTGRKYSFSDSPDWWDGMEVKDGDPRLASRPTFYLDIQLP